MTRRVLTGLAIALALAASAGSALAGGYDPENSTHRISVYTNSDGSGSASGAPRVARDAPELNSNIGCAVTARPRALSVRCYATDKNGKTLICSSTRSSLIDAALAVSENSKIEFVVEADGECSYLYVSNSGTYIRPVQACPDNRVNRFPGGVLGRP